MIELHSPTLPTFLTTFREANKDAFNSLENIGSTSKHETTKKSESCPSTENDSFNNNETDKSMTSDILERKDRRPQESLAERAKSISKSKITTLKKNLSVDDLVKYVPGLHNIGYETDSTDQSHVSIR